MQGINDIKHVQIVIDRSNPKEIMEMLQGFLKAPCKIPNNDISLKIQPLANSENIGVRFWAKKLLAKLGKYSENFQTSNSKSKILPNQPVKILINKLKSVDSTHVSLEVIRKLCESKSQEAFSFLKDYLTECNDVFQISYLTKSIGKNFPTKETFELILPFLKHSDGRIVANTIEGLEVIDYPEAVVHFAKLLKHNNNRVQINAAKALNRFKPEMTFIALSKMLKPEAPTHFQISACHAVKTLKDPRYLPMLEKLLYCSFCFPYALSALRATSEKKASEILARNYSNFEPEKQELIEPFLNSDKNSKINVIITGEAATNKSNHNSNKAHSESVNNPTPEVFEELKESAASNIFSPVAEFWKQRRLILTEPEQMFLKENSKLRIMPLEFAFRGILGVSLIIKCIGEIIFFLQDDKTILVTTKLSELKFTRLLDIVEEFIPILFLVISAFIFRYWLKIYEDQCPRVKVADRVYLYYVTSRLFILNMCIAISAQTEYYLLTALFASWFLVSLGSIALEFSNILGLSESLEVNEAKKITLNGIIMSSLISLLAILILLLLLVLAFNEAFAG